MASKLGSATYKLTASDEKLRGVLRRAQEHIKSWVGKAKSGIASIAGSTIGKGFVLGIGFEAARRTIGSLTEGFGELRDTIDRTAKDSRRLGTTMEVMQGLEHAAGLSGVKVETLRAGLMRFRKDVEGPLDQALVGVAEQLEGMTDPGERANLLFSKFGRSGVELATMFEGGSAGLQSMIGEAQTLGFALSGMDAGKVESANDAMARVKAAATGLYQKILLALTPAIEFWADRFTSLLRAIQPVFDWLRRALDRYWQILSGVFEAVVDAVWYAIDTLSVWGEGLFAWTDDLPTIEEVITTVLKSIIKSFAYMWDAIKVGAMATVVVFSYVVDGVADIVDRTKEGIRSLLELASNLPGIMGGPGFGLIADNLNILVESMDGAGAEMREWAGNPLDGWGDSAEAVDVWFDELLKPRVVKPKLQIERKDFTDAMPSGGDSGDGSLDAALAGSSAAYAIEAKFKNSSLLGKDDIGKQQLNVQKKQLGVLGEIHDAIDEQEAFELGVI